MIIFGIFVYCCSLLVFRTHGLSLPSYISPCTRNSLDFDKCALENGRKATPYLFPGDPEFGIPVLDPWLVEELSVKELGLTLSSKNFTITGFSKGQLESIKTDFQKQSVNLDYRVPEIRFVGSYEMYGRLLSLPISGKGDFHCTMYDTIVRYKIKFEVTRKDDGKEYATPVWHDMEYIPKDMKFELENLFNSKSISSVMNKLLNDHWKIVLEEAGKPSSRAFGAQIRKIISNVTEKIPLSDFFSESR